MNKESQLSAANILNKAPRPQSHFDSTWISRRLRNLFPIMQEGSISSQASELLRSKRLTDVTVNLGRVTAKISDPNSGTKRIGLILQPISSDNWQLAFEKLSEKSIYLALMLSGVITPSVEKTFRHCNLNLVPESASEFKIVLNSKEQTPGVEAAALLTRFCDKIDSDPFCFMQFRGRTRQEIIQELRKIRGQKRQQQPSNSPLPYSQINYDPVLPLHSSAENFWSSGRDLSTLSYCIKADELPASILRWLDPLPLDGLEEEVELQLQDAYDRITRLAQGFGLRM